MAERCQMTVQYELYPELRCFSEIGYCKCNRPAKFRVPTPFMGVEYVCGMHARSVDATYRRVKVSDRCIKL